MIRPELPHRQPRRRFLPKTTRRDAHDDDMAALCTQCGDMAIPRLVELAKKEYRANFFPHKAFYSHHASFAELEKCVNEWTDRLATATTKPGCPLCRLILRCFQHTQHDPEYSMWPSMAAGWTGQDPHVVSVAEAAHKLQQAGQPTDIRVALYGRHMATGAWIDSVRMFDIIMVRVGDYQDTAGPLRIPNLPLVIRLPREPTTPLAGKQLPPVVAGFQIGCLAGWTPAFTATLNAGSTKAAPRLPTRVVDVASSPPRVVHAADVGVGTKDHGRGSYAALSHCWGGPIAARLTTATMAAYSKALPSSQLPPNFCDAVAITRSLGLRFVWIDSLCIIQDAKEDWLREARRMGDVYSRATVSLLAMSAKGSTAGILHPQTPPPPKHAFESVTIHVADDANGNTPVALDISAVDRYEENLRILDENGPLSERGWTLQELVLSTRVLFFGQRQIYWYCPTSRYLSADGQPPGNSFPYEKYPHLSVGLYSGIPNAKADGNAQVHAILDDYYNLVVAYSRRRLTFGSDKLPALSGLAQQVHRALIEAAGPAHSAKFTYLAGLWTADINRGLLFYPDGMHCPHVTGDFRAPSWSWAATDSPVIFIAPEWRLDRKPHPLNMQLCSSDITLLDSQNAFGPVTAAHLIVKGRLGCLCRSTQTFSSGPYSWTTYDEAGTAWFDEPPAGGTGPNPYCLILRKGHGNSGSAEDEDMLLSVYLCSRQFAVDIGSETRVELEVDWEQYEKEKYTLLLVDMGEEQNDSTARGSSEDGSEDDDDWVVEEQQINCLILKQVEQGQAPYQDGAFERVGCLVFDWKNKIHVEKWPLRTIKLV